MSIQKAVKKFAPIDVILTATGLPVIRLNKIAGLSRNATKISRWRGGAAAPSATEALWLRVLARQLESGALTGEQLRNLMEECSA